MSLRYLHPRAVAGALAGAALSLGALTGPAIAAGMKDNSACPDLSGHYRVAEFGDINNDVLQALSSRMAGFLDSEVRFGQGVGKDWELFIKSGASGRFPSRPSVTLRHGTDFACRDGWVELITPVRTNRKTEQGWFEGQSVVLLNRASPKGLRLTVRFSGSQRSNVFQYDSARLSLPVPGTGMRLNEAIRWPDVSEPAPTRIDNTPPAPEAPAVAQTRQRLSASMLGQVILTGLKPDAQGVRASLKATQSNQVAAFEDRLRSAGMGYRVMRQPLWSNNAHEFELLILPAGSTAAWRPSLLWVDSELRRTRHPMAEPGSIQVDPQGYRVLLTLSGGTQAQDVATRIQTLSSAFAMVQVQQPVDVSSASGARTAQLLLVMK